MKQNEPRGVGWELALSNMNRLTCACKLYKRLHNRCVLYVYLIVSSTEFPNSLCVCVCHLPPSQRSADLRVALTHTIHSPVYVLVRPHICYAHHVNCSIFIFCLPEKMVLHTTDQGSGCTRRRRHGLHEKRKISTKK